MIICEGVDEMRHVVANTMLNFYHGELQEVGEVKCLKVALIEDEIVYRRNVKDASLSTSIPGPSMSYDDIVPPHIYMDIIDPFLSWTSWGDASDLSTSVSGPSMSASGPFMS